ncbi:MAG: hypothetical protein LBG17_09380 [Bacteroidales bacterium]|nr:hypothetical protein [Bacteroidales bacterium]
MKYNKYDDLNLTWLVTGEGEMLLSSPPNEQIEKLEKKNIELIKQIAVLEYQLEQANRQKKTKK